MTSKTDRPVALRALRQLRRVRAFYGAGVVLWAVSTAWTGWRSPGDRQMWVSALLLVIFTGLLLTASLWLQRLRTVAAGPAGPVRRAASQRTAGPRHLHA
ncbi:hypothetical protein [Streptomyces triticiradicis]|uniref:Uncharacterized protein n=1 Tax=Streptomyces triticiradicis TaxID=2651189 RepID=A0A7J5D6C0_9ACTN|nr:hypothetical protein [Streptomyces triticiradicis]KAB1978826.1 hypothetical protein F8144_37855 [Streptomyces triticiradicis]